MSEMGFEIENLLNELEDLLEESKATITGGKIKVDKESVAEIINEIRLNLPEDMRSARAIMTDAQSILDKAEADAAATRAAADEEADRLCQENEIVRRAKAAATEILTQAKAQADSIVAKATNEAHTVKDAAQKWSDDLRTNTINFVDGSMTDADELLMRAVSDMERNVENIRSAREQIRRYVSSKNG